MDHETLKKRISEKEGLKSQKYHLEVHLLYLFLWQLPKYVKMTKIWRHLLLEETVGPINFSKVAMHDKF